MLVFKNVWSEDGSDKHTFVNNNPNYCAQQLCIKLVLVSILVIQVH